MLLLYGKWFLFQSAKVQINSCVHWSLLLQEKAIAMAWDFLVNVLKLPMDRLYVTYFKGKEELNLPPDEETKQIWLDIG